MPDFFELDRSARHSFVFNRPKRRLIALFTDVDGRP